MILTDKIIRTFIKQMRKAHPLDRTTYISFRFHPGTIIRGDKELYGTVMRNIGSNRVKVIIDTDRPPLLVLKTIAHEYRHIMQWMNTNMEWFTHSSKIRNTETDAQLFAGPVARDFFYSLL